MVKVMDKSPNITKKRIINLVKQPFDFFDLYNTAAEEDEKLENSLLEQLRVTVDEWSKRSQKQ